MSKEQLTAWYPGNIAPEYDGVYQRNGTGYAKFENGVWYCGCSTIHDAAKMRTPSLFQSVTGEAPRWRGRAKP